MRTIAVFAACVLAAGSAGAQRLFDYSGPDRMAKITAAAKKEGTVTMYTTFAEKDQPTLIRPFEAKYGVKVEGPDQRDRKSTRLNSSHVEISYAVFCLKKKKKKKNEKEPE